MSDSSFLASLFIGVVAVIMLLATCDSTPRQPSDPDASHSMSGIGNQ